MAENAFVNTNRYPKNNEVDENDENPRKRRKKEKRKAADDSASSSGSHRKTRKSLKKLFKSCGGCCKRKKRSKGTKSSFGEYIRKKSKKSRTKKTKDKHPDAATAKHPENEDKQEEQIEDTKKAKTKRRKKKKKEDASDQPADGSAPDNQILGIDVQDFKKTCCYLCAQNAMAIAAAAAAAAGKMGKSDVSIQTSSKFKEMSTMDKGCHPMMYVRTVQSSVKVKTRDMGTLHPERKKTRRKLNLKKHALILRRIKVNIMKNIQKIKLPSYPKVRTVACGTEKSMGRNVPQCRATHGAHCAKNG